MYSDTLMYHLNLYQEAGLKTIPIAPGRKKPPPSGYITMTSEEMWQDAEPNSNIALYVGHNGLFLLDPDNDAAVSTVANHFEGLGVHPFQVISRSGRPHSYIKTNAPEDIQCSGDLKGEKGEWMARHLYGVTAPSVVEGSSYMLAGDPKKIPYVEWGDVTPLLKFRTSSRMSSVGRSEKQVITANAIPVPLIRRKLHDWTMMLISELWNAKKGRPIKIDDKEWPSRSEATMSAVMSLVLARYDFDEITKYFRMQDRNKDWLYLVYSRGIEFIINTDERQQLASMYQSNITFPGVTGITDTKVYKAAIAIAWYADSFDAKMTLRDFHVLTTCAYDTIRASLKRLVQGGRIKKLSSDTKGNKYRIIRNDEYFPQTGTKDKPPTTVSFVPEQRKIVSPELFRWGALTKTAELVYSVLSDEPKKVKELQVLTMRSKTSIYNALAKLKEVGLAEKVGRSWIIGSANIEDVEKKYQTSDAEARRRKKVQEERYRFYQAQREFAIRRAQAIDESE